MKEPSVEEINAVVDSYRKNMKRGQTKFVFSRKGKTFASCIVNGAGREMDYLAMTLSKQNHCSVKVCRKETYL